MRISNRALCVALAATLGVMGGCALQAESDTGEAAEALETYSCTMDDGSVAAVLLVTQGLRPEAPRLCYPSRLTPAMPPASGLPSCRQRAREVECVLLKLPPTLRGSFGEP